MAWYNKDSAQYLEESENKIFDNPYIPGETAPVSGIYRCTVCGHEMTSIKGKTLPTQNHAQQGCDKKMIVWKLIVGTKTETILE